MAKPKKETTDAADNAEASNAQHVIVRANARLVEDSIAREPGDTFTTTAERAAALGDLVSEV